MELMKKTTRARACEHTLRDTHAQQERTAHTNDQYTLGVKKREGGGGGEAEAVTDGDDDTLSNYSSYLTKEIKLATGQCAHAHKHAPPHFPPPPQPDLSTTSINAT